MSNQKSDPMKIAILGWGSLIWNPGQLLIDKKQGTDGWFTDGPLLPIEFSRISKDGRLTLVIQPDVEEIQTLYAISQHTDLELAILDLAVREGSGKNKIGYFSNNAPLFPKISKFEKNIKIWLDKHKELDAVIWTNLSSNYKDKLAFDKFTPDHAINYLKYLPPATQVKAEEYFRKTPLVVKTEIRDAVEKELGWTPISNI